MQKPISVILAAAILMMICLVGLTAGGCSQSDSEKTDETSEKAEIITNLPKIDMTAWQYDADHDFYYQADIVYCETPAVEKYEKLMVCVPGVYMDATENSGTYSCELNESAEVNGYTAASAPIVMPIITPSYIAAEPIDSGFLEANAYAAGMVAEFTSQGMVYVYPGCRGLLEGAPAGVTDLKAAIRYLRYCDDVIAGDAESIFVFGTSGGGAQAAILGASGDSALYDPYLEAIGAVQGVSDAVAGSMAWCPITDLDTADAEYEWMMGCTRAERSDEWNAISDELAEAFAAYVNSARFTDKDGNLLTLTQSKEGICQAGTYYDYIKGVIERSLNNYLSDTTFTAGTVQDYIDSLNADRKWVTYDKSTNTASITSIEDFVKTCKPASNDTVAFDSPGGKKMLFGCGGDGAHFDRILTDILIKQNSEYAAEYTEDLDKTDPFGYTVEQRVEMYTPLFYLMKNRGGYGTSKAAKYWRIRSGIAQSTTSLTTEVNLALALENCKGVESVDFETVWAQKHTEAERTGDSTSNFIEWVNICMKGS